MDDVAKRREARRRKILENSQDRLSRITGVEQKSSMVFVCENAKEPTETTESPSNSTILPNETTINEVQQKKVNEKQPPKQYRKTVISALAVFVNILLLIGENLFDSSSSHVNKIFLPLFVYEVIEFFSNNEKQTSLGFIYLLLAANSKNKYIVAVMRYLDVFVNVLQDVMLYFFVFVWCDFVRWVLS